MKNSVDLYKLPKDLLVKLLLTIQEDVRKEEQRKTDLEREILKNTYDFINERAQMISLDRCPVEGCNGYEIWYDRDFTRYNCENMKSCQCRKKNCLCPKSSKLYCTKHLSEGKLRHCYDGVIGRVYCDHCIKAHIGEDNVRFCEGCEVCNPMK